MVNQEFEKQFAKGVTAASFYHIAKYWFELGQTTEREDCHLVAKSALCHAGLDEDTCNYIADNIKGRVED